jgi:uncharacterized protein YqeY
MLEEKLEQDIKSALLSGDSFKVTTLRGLKANLLNLKVATGKRETGLSDDEVIQVYLKEAKKRQESADLYKQGGNSTRYEAELNEKKIIEGYLPDQLSEEEIAEAVDKAIADTGASSMADMGKVIGQVKAQLGATADGSIVAKLAKEKLQ